MDDEALDYLARLEQLAAEQGGFTVDQRTALMMVTGLWDQVEKNQFLNVYFRALRLTELARAAFGRLGGDMARCVPPSQRKPEPQKVEAYECLECGGLYLDRATAEACAVFASTNTPWSRRDVLRFWGGADNTVRVRLREEEPPRP